jgi:hypothetical protein
MAVMGIKERDGAPTLSTDRGETECFEAYIIEVTAEG